MRRRAGRLAVLALAGALLLTGCGPVNAGSAGREAFTEAFADDPAVSALELTSTNDLPWAGTVSGTVVARDELGDDELHDLVDRIGAYAVESRGANVSVDVEVDGIAFPVLDSRERNADLVGLVSELRDDDRIATAILGLRYAGNSSVEMTARDAEAVFALGRELPDSLSTLGLGGSVDLTVTADDGSVRIEGEPGEWLGQGEATWLAVNRVAEVSGVVVTPESIELQVVREQNVADATEVARATLAGSALRLTVGSDLLRLSEGSDGTPARDLLSGLDDETVGLILTGWTNDETLHLTLASQEALLPVALGVAALPEAESFSTVALFVDGADAGDAASPGTFSVYADPLDLPARVESGLTVAGTPGVDAVSLARDRLEATASPSVDEAEVGRFAAVLKAAARPGDWTCIEASENGSVCTKAADTIALEDVPNSDHPGATEFVRAWNAAPPVGEKE